MASPLLNIIVCAKRLNQHFSHFVGEGSSEVVGGSVLHLPALPPLHHNPGPASSVGQDASQAVVGCAALAAQLSCKSKAGGLPGQVVPSGATRPLPGKVELPVPAPISGLRQRPRLGSARRAESGRRLSLTLRSKLATKLRIGFQQMMRLRGATRKHFVRKGPRFESYMVCLRNWILAPRLAGSCGFKISRAGFSGLTPSFRVNTSCRLWDAAGAARNLVFA